MEENGFMLVDFTQASMRLSFFRRSPKVPESAIERLTPFKEMEFKR